MYSPAGQSSHCVCPGDDWNCPTGHNVQVEPCVPAVALKEPAGQGVPGFCKQKQEQGEIREQLTCSTVRSGFALSMNGRDPGDEDRRDQNQCNLVAACASTHRYQESYCC